MKTPRYDPAMIAHLAARGKTFDPTSMVHQQYAMRWDARGGPPPALATGVRSVAALLWLIVTLAVVMPVKVLAFAAVVLVPKPRMTRVPEVLTWGRGMEIVRGGPPLRR